MKAYFEQFGVVSDCVVMKDPSQAPNLKRNRYIQLYYVSLSTLSVYRDTWRHHVIMTGSLTCRGFGFVTFEDPAAVDRVLSPGVTHTLDDKTVSRVT